MKKGIAYAVGVGPGDPELITLKAIKVIKESDCIAAVGDNPKESIAYKIIENTIENLEEKTIIGLQIPMIKDIDKVKSINAENAKILEEYLDKGMKVAFITIGDPTVFCSFSYIQEVLRADGYDTQLINGVTSFCAAAAAVNTPLVQWKENLHIISTSLDDMPEMEKDTGYVYMKVGKKSGEIRDYLNNSNTEAYAVENCGLVSERRYCGVNNIPDSMDYLSIIICRN